MKKEKKKRLCFLLACMLLCTLAIQSVAATSYDATAGVSGQILFPGDSLTAGAETAFVVNDEAVSPETPGIWTNSDSDRVYAATTEEEGASIQIRTAGYVLVVEGGKSKKPDENADNTWNHYTFQEDEKPETPQDLAFYSAGETVQIEADKKDGMVFAGWETDDETVVIEGKYSPEATLVMPDKKVTVTADYTEETQSETPAPEQDVPSGDFQEGTEDGTSDGQTSDQYTDGTSDGQTADPYTDDASDGQTADPYTDSASDTETPGQYVEIAPDVETADLITDEASGAESGDLPETETIYYNVAVTDATLSDGTDKGLYAAGTLVTVNANDYTSDGQKFYSWYVASGNVEGLDLSSASVTFAVPEGNVALVATYEPIEEGTESSDAADTLSGAGTLDGAEDAAAAAASAYRETKSSDGAEDAASTYTVTVTNGTVKDSESATYEVGSEVTVIADTPEDGPEFSFWEVTGGDVDLADPSNSTTTFTMPESDVTVEAVYAASGTPKPYSEETGTSTSILFIDSSLETASFTVTAGDTAVPANDDGAYTIPSGAEVAVTAGSVEGYTFSGWTTESADILLNNPSVASITFTMPSSDVKLTADYTQNPAEYTITVANGVVTSGFTANSGSSWTVTEGTEITITANTASAGNTFSGWTITDSAGSPVTLDGVDTTAPTITLNPTQSLNFTANYTGIQYSVTVTSGTANYSTVVSGTTVTITADAASEGMEFDAWSVTSGNVSLADASSSTTTFIMPAANVTVTATYRRVSYTLTVKNGYSDAPSYYMGDTATVSSDYPAEGREFSYWEAVSGNVDFAEDYLWETTLTMPASNVTVKAVYKDGPSTDDNLILGITEGGEYYTGETIKFTASGAGMDEEGLNPGDYRYRPSGYQIGNVTGAWSSEPYSTSMSIKAVGEYTLKVTFAREVYDGSNWAADGTTDVKSVTFRVVNSTSVATGDSTPILTFALIAGAALLVAVILLVVSVRRRKHRP